MTRRKKYLLISWLPVILLLMGFTLYAVFVAIGTGTPLGDMGLMMVFVFLTWAFEAPEALRAIALFSITCLLFGIIGTIVSIIKTRNSSQGQTRF